MALLTETSGSQNLILSIGDELNYQLRRGTTLTAPFQYTEDDEVTPIDITGDTIAAFYATTLESAAAIAFAVTITDAVNGQFEIEIDATASRAMSEKTYYWDLKLIESGGVERALLYGVITVLDQVKAGG